MKRRMYGVDQRDPIFRKAKLKDNDPIFDGFAHRGFDERIDGWMNALADDADYPAVHQARDVLEMFEEIQDLRAENWRLQRIENDYNSLLRGHSSIVPLFPVEKKKVKV